MKRLPLPLAVCLLATASIHLNADGPKDNQPDQVRPIPPAGIALPEADRDALQKGVKELEAEIQGLKVALEKKPALLALLPDVEIFHKSVDWALRYNEFFKPAEATTARAQLEQGKARAKALREGQSPWTTQTGLVVRGYRSQIDNSVQPYGLVVPAGYQPDGNRPHRLDIWCHGRGETLSELAFIDGRQKSPGEYTPPGGFVLHPYGRYCNANKFAGEVDLFEAINHAMRNYRLDEDRIVMRGFSMGGAAAWHFTVHYPSRWAASNPGAGFSETPEFLKVFQDETLEPTIYEQRLWNWYDCPGYVRNLANCPTIAYSGEDDKQRQAATRMEEAATEQGFSLTHIIGPKTGHKIHPESKLEIARRLDRIVERGRDRFPETVHFATYTLRYANSAWVTVEGMLHHWEQAKVDARVDRNERQFVVDTDNVTALTLHVGPGDYPLDPISAVNVRIDGQNLPAPAPQSDRSWTAHFRKINTQWHPIDDPHSLGLQKRPGLQGPIDDAFLSRFIVVRPTGKPFNEKTADWVQSELAHFVTHWRSQFRGEIIVRDDTSITDEEMAEANLILWGDPASNKIIGRVLKDLPLKWTKETLEIGPARFAAASHMPALIYPNPVDQNRYVVINSGFTYREYDYLNNARQVAKLPDWALIDLAVKPNSKAPGGIAAAGFFGEHWNVTSPH